MGTGRQNYTFDTEEGHKTLKDLFDGRSQLLVYHFMFGPEYKAGCASCSSIADGFNGIAVHLDNHDVVLFVVSRAPLAKLRAFKQRMGWTFPWASSVRGEFNFDFNVSFTEEQQREGGGEYNYRRGGVRAMATIPEIVIVNAAMTGADPVAYVRERPGMSTFVLEDAWFTKPIRPMRADWTASGVPVARPRAPKGRNETGLVASPR